MKTVLFHGHFTFVHTLCLCIAHWASIASAEEVLIEWFKTHHPDKQEDTVACWAAATAAALQSKDIAVTQGDVKQAIHGNKRARSLSDPDDLLKVMSNLPLDSQQLRLTLTEPDRWISFEEFNEEIEEGNPFIVGYKTGPNQSHIVIVYGGDVGPKGGYYLIWDPWNGECRKESLAQFNQVARFFSIVHVEHKSVKRPDPDLKSDNGTDVIPDPSSQPDSDEAKEELESAEKELAANQKTLRKWKSLDMSEAAIDRVKERIAKAERRVAKAKAMLRP